MGNGPDIDRLQTRYLRGPLLDSYYGSNGQKQDVAVIAREIMTRYLAKVPKDSGALAASAKVTFERGEDRNRRWIAVFSAGGPKAPHAAVIEAEQGILAQVLRDMGYKTGDMGHGPRGRRGPAPLSDSQRTALQSYAAGGYASVNKLLRGQELSHNTPEDIREAQREAAEIRAALSGRELSTDIRVTRTTSLAAFGGDANNVIGRTFVEKGFMSTSLNDLESETPAEARGQVPVHLSLVVRQGTRGIEMDSSLSKYHDVENELLLDAGRNITITGVDNDERGGYRMTGVVE